TGWGCGGPCGQFHPVVGDYGGHRFIAGLLEAGGPGVLCNPLADCRQGRQPPRAGDCQLYQVPTVGGGNGPLPGAGAGFQGEKTLSEGGVEVGGDEIPTALHIVAVVAKAVPVGGGPTEGNPLAVEALQQG